MMPQRTRSHHQTVRRLTQWQTTPDPYIAEIWVVHPISGMYGNRVLCLVAGLVQDLVHSCCHGMPWLAACTWSGLSLQPGKWAVNIHYSRWTFSPIGWWMIQPTYRVMSMTRYTCQYESQ